MLTYCVKCRKDTENIDPKMVRTINKDKLCSQNALFAELKIYERTRSKGFIE